MTFSCTVTGLTKYRRPAPSLFRLLNSMPSTIWRMSPVRAPCTEMRTDCSPLDPPTSRPLAGDTAPGTRAISPPMLLLVGSASIIAWLMTCSRVTPFTSMMGVSPVTVTVSATAPTFRSIFSVAVKLVLSSMPSRRSVVNPGRVYVTV